MFYVAEPQNLQALNLFTLHQVAASSSDKHSKRTKRSSEVEAVPLEEAESGLHNDSQPVLLFNGQPIEVSQVDSAVTWEEYWNQFGDQLVWNGWVERYGAYIDDTQMAPPCMSEETIIEDSSGRRNTYHISAICCLKSDSLRFWPTL